MKYKIETNNWRHAVLCEICHRRSNHNGPGKRMFMARFPSDEYRCREWLKVVGNEKLLAFPIEMLHRRKYVCVNHFEKKDFNKFGSRLRKTAVPSINLTAKPLPNEMLTKFSYYWKRRKKRRTIIGIISSLADHNYAYNPPDPPILRKLLVFHDHNYCSSVKTVIKPPPKRKIQSSTVPSTTEQKTLILNLEKNEEVDEPTKIKYISTTGKETVDPSTSEQLLLLDQDNPPKEKKHIYTSPAEPNEIKYMNIPDPAISKQLQLLFQANCSKEKMRKKKPDQPTKRKYISNTDASATEHRKFVLHLDKDGIAIKIKPKKKVAERTKIKNISTTDPSSPGEFIAAHHDYDSDPPDLPPLEQSQSLDQENCPKKKKRKEITATPTKGQNKSGSDLEHSLRKGKVDKEKKEPKPKVLPKRSMLPPMKPSALKNLMTAYLLSYGKPSHAKQRTRRRRSRRLRRLQTLLQQMDLVPGINPTILEHLKKEASTLIHPRDRICALLFDEFSLQKRLVFNPRTDKIEGFVDYGENKRSSDVADHAVMFMLQGLNSDIKLPIAYYFVKETISSQDLAVFIKDIIRATMQTGFTVITTVCDQGLTNIDSLNLLKQECDVPDTSNYFFVDDARVFVMFDVPQLFKSIRNHFHSGGVIVMGDKVGKWCHVKDAVEKNESMLHIKKISPMHINHVCRPTAKVKMSAELLSNTVAAILKLMADGYGGDYEKAQEILGTAHIIENLDRLFDCTNGPSCKEDVIKHRREIVSKRTMHVALWREYKEIVSTMCFLKAKAKKFVKLDKVRCTQGYITTLSSLEDIWTYLDSKGLRFLNLRMLNKENLETLFRIIRRDYPTNNAPTCHHFTAALKCNILTTLGTRVSKGAHWDINDSKVMIDLEDFFKNHSNAGVVQLENPQNLEQNAQILNHDEAPVVRLPEYIEISESDQELLQIEHNLMESFETQHPVYIAGYLATVILKKMRRKCPICKLSLCIEDPELALSTYSDVSVDVREWLNDRNILTYPSVRLTELIIMMTSHFAAEVKPFLHGSHISQQAVTMMLTKCDDSSWLCNTHKDSLLLELMFRLIHILIRNECNRMNLSFAKPPTKQKQTAKKARGRSTLDTSDIVMITYPPVTICEW